MEDPVSTVLVSLYCLFDQVQVILDIVRVHSVRIQYAPVFPTKQRPGRLLPIVSLLVDVILLLVEAVVESAFLSPFDQYTWKVAVQKTNAQVFDDVVYVPVGYVPALELLL